VKEMRRRKHRCRMKPCHSAKGTGTTSKKKVRNKNLPGKFETGDDQEKRKFWWAPNHGIHMGGERGKTGPKKTNAEKLGKN